MFRKLFTMVFGICSFATFIAFCHYFVHRINGQLWQLELELFLGFLYISFCFESNCNGKQAPSNPWDLREMFVFLWRKKKINFEQEINNFLECRSSWLSKVQNVVKRDSRITVYKFTFCQS